MAKETFSFEDAQTPAPAPAPARASGPAAGPAPAPAAAADEPSAPADGPKTFSFEEAQTPEPKAQERGIVSELGRQVALTGRAAVSGLVALPAMAADGLIVTPVNAALDAVKGRGNGYRLPSQAQAVDEAMTKAGVAAPENATERIVQDAAGAMAGAGGMVKAGRVLSNAAGPVARGLGDMLAAGPKTQVVGGATGGLASGITREEGGGAGAQIAAGLAGGVGPSLLTAGGQAGLRGALRGGATGRQRVADTVKLFDDAAGASPSLAQATGKRWQEAAESGLAKTPGSAGVMARAAEIQANRMAQSVKQLSEQLAPGANAISAGEAIQRGVEGFKQGLKVVQKRLYDTLDQHLAPDTRITSDRTRAALADLNADIAGAPELSKWFKNARIQGIEGGLKSDTESLDAVLSRPGVRQQADNLRTQLQAGAAKIEQANVERRTLGMSNLEPVPAPADIDGQVQDFLRGQVDARLPYESIKKLRTLVGNELDGNSLVADVPRSKWKALYGALSDDLGDAAKAAGPQAEERWNWANKFTSMGMERLEALHSIVGRDAPEKVFSAALQGTAEGNSIVSRVFSAIPKSNQREVAAAVLQRLGKATAGQQNEAADAFSSSTFLTNWSKVSPEARQTIFGNIKAPGLARKLTELGKIAEMQRQGSKVFANPSGTAGATAQMAGMGGLIGALASGNPTTIAAAVGIPMMANGVARLATRPSNMRFLAEPTRFLQGSQAAALGGLVQGATHVQAAPDASGVGGGPDQNLIEQFSAPDDGQGQPTPVQGAPTDLGVIQAPANASDAAAELDPNPPVPVVPAGPTRLERIERLRAAGEDDAADVLQQAHDRDETGAAITRELKGMQAADPALPFHGHPAFEQAYAAYRHDGEKPAAAAARASMMSAVQLVAPKVGMSEKALAALADATKKMPLKDLPQFVSRYATSLGKSGGMKPLPAGTDVAVMLGQLRDRALHAGMDAAYQPPPPVAAAPADAAAPAQVAALEQRAQPAPADVPENAAPPLESQPAGTQLAQADPENVPVVPPADDPVHAAATSPHNDLPEPTEAQKEAGNYKMGHIRIAGMDLTIENPEGSVRRGIDPDGKPWETEMRSHYGYLRKSTANDGEHLDVFVKPGTPEDFRGSIYVVDQHSPGGGFDEHKAILGARSEEEAAQLYRENYADDWQGMGGITKLPLAAFKAWAKSGDKKEPLGQVAIS